MQYLKLRLILGGSIVSVLGAVLFVARGHALPFLGLLIVGIVALAVGLLWPKAKAQESPRNDTE